VSTRSSSVVEDDIARRLAQVVAGMTDCLVVDGKAAVQCLLIAASTIRANLLFLLDRSTSARDAGRVGEAVLEDALYVNKTSTLNDLYLTVNDVKKKV
jgi:hypothetical protein